MAKTIEGDSGIAFSTAESYHELVIMAENSGGIDLAPIVTNITFACELYLKAIILYKQGSVKPVHSIEELFNQLDEEDKEIIKNSSKIFDWTQFMEELDAAFVTWRYLYENCQLNKCFSISISDRIRFEVSLKNYYMNIVK